MHTVQLNAQTLLLGEFTTVGYVDIFVFKNGVTNNFRKCHAVARVSILK